jgi:hypothetical protein
MKPKTTTQRILNVLQVLSWIIFLGLCVEAGSIIFHVIYTYAYNPANDTYPFWKGTDLWGLYNYGFTHFVAMVSLVVIVIVFKALMFYLIVKLFTERQLNMAQPFNRGLRQFLLRTAYLSTAIGLCTHFGYKYYTWLSEQNIALPNVAAMHLTGGDVWLFMAVILFVIVQIITRGVEIQTENDLTV